jgi:hypothetical protein
VKPLGDDSVSAGDHRSDQRVRAHPATALLGELDRASQMHAVGINACCHLRF